MHSGTIAPDLRINGIRTGCCGHWSLVISHPLDNSEDKRSAMVSSNEDDVEDASGIPGTRRWLRRLKLGSKKAKMTGPFSRATFHFHRFLRRTQKLTANSRIKKPRFHWKPLNHRLKVDKIRIKHAPLFCRRHRHHRDHRLC